MPAAIEQDRHAVLRLDCRNYRRLDRQPPLTTCRPPLTQKLTWMNSGVSPA